ncbi:hypothetical protein D8674_030322 [Pyrus ussuriensis x Pyrus communis]|uniref:Uncharacterized protein n=1 Tax=Pyrus ussuriensis x Pyrus communis TaxID=2448454 RepID=A0A5N5F0R6_9ROSA|nr:hypothetical protein D8674_030322 [Pyrus ussuriensis x Pyrus communis]
MDMGRNRISQFDVEAKREKNRSGESDPLELQEWATSQRPSKTRFSNNEENLPVPILLKAMKKTRRLPRTSESIEENAQASQNF